YGPRPSACRRGVRPAGAAVGMSTPPPPSRPDLPTLLDLFPPSDLAGFEFVDAAAVAPPYHGLLVHEHHMTVTVEGFYRDFVDVKILGRRHDLEVYARKILLALELRRRIVQYGIVRSPCLNCSEAQQAKSVTGQTPLARI